MKGFQNKLAEAGRQWIYFLLVLAAYLFASPLHAITFNINYSEEPSPSDLIAYDISIIHPNAKADLAPAKHAGNKVLAYLSVVEVAHDAPYKDKVRKLRIPSLGKNELWKSDLMDVSSDQWHGFVLGELVPEILNKGFDGFFLDTPESVDTLASLYPQRAASFRKGLIALVQKLRASNPDKFILINRGFSLFPDVAPSVDGLLVESLFNTYSFQQKKYLPVSQADTRWLLSKIEPIAAGGRQIFIADFADPDAPDTPRQTAEKISALGFHALVTTPDFSGRHSAPLQPVHDRILAIYGNSEQGLLWPSDSFVSNALQMPLEWMGFKVDYATIPEALASGISPSCRAIILDRYLKISQQQESGLAEWLLEQKEKGVKLVFIGRLPFDQLQSDAAISFAKKLGVTIGKPPLPATDEVQRTTKRPDTAPVKDKKNNRKRIAKVRSVLAVNPSIIGFETPLNTPASTYYPISAPKDAALHLSLEIESPATEPFRHDAVFTTEWGGIALEPFITFTRPDYYELWVLNPFAFLSEILGDEMRPVCDPNTRDGLRVFFSHIDGDGFRNMSAVVKGMRSSEIIRDEVLKRYPFPVTFSIIESEIRAHIENQPPEDEAVLEEIARSIFALPNIQAASHTYTHPFFWMPDDNKMGVYKERGLILAKNYKLNTVDVEREIVGSVNYINEKLLPPDKKVEIFLWSGNCRPGPEALAVTERLGLPNMNGGDTFASKIHPSAIMVKPRSVPWKNHLQIHCAMQNEMLYTHDFEGPLWGGFARVLETFQMTETPRRLKPVGLYYHVYCGDRLEALRPLQNNYEWVLKQPLHAITAAEFAHMVEDDRRTSVYRRSDNSWVLANHGAARTFRIPDKGLLPDLHASEGILGYNRENGFIYIHASPLGKSKLVLARDVKQHLFLVSSTAPIYFSEMGEKKARFNTKDYRDARVIFGGLSQQSEIKITVNGKTLKKKSDAQGRLELELPKEAEAEVACF